MKSFIAQILLKTGTVSLLSHRLREKLWKYLNASHYLFDLGNLMMRCRLDHYPNYKHTPNFVPVNTINRASNRLSRKRTSIIDQEYT